MKKTLLFCLLSFLVISSWGQGKLFTIKEAVQGQGSTFAPVTFSFLQWRGKSTSYTWVTGYKEMHTGVVNTTGDRVFLTLADMNAALKQGGKKGGEEMSYFPYDYQWISDSVFYFTHDGQVIFFNAFTKTVMRSFGMKDESGLTSVSPVYNMIAYTVKDNIYISDGGPREKAVTTDGGNGIVYGSDYVHRQEFGIDKGMFWSPAGNYLAFYRKDESMVADYPLVNTGERIATLKNIKYPMAGMTSEQVTLGVYGLRSGKTVYIRTDGPKDQYLTCISWDPAEKYIYIGVLNREQNHLKMNQYDIATGNLVKTLFEEQSPKYVEPENPLYFLKSRPDQFIWQSERDGYNHLYLYKNDGTFLKQLTSGNWIVTEILGPDAKEENLYFMSASANGLSREISSVNLKTGKVTHHTKEGGTHHAVMSPGGTYLLDSYSSLSVPNRIDIYKAGSGPVQELLKAEDPYKEYSMPKAELITLTAADGVTQLNGRIIKPVDFDPAKKYPVVVYVYGGPHAQLVTDSWLGGARLWEYYMAQKGYIMFTLDNRGSANHGLEFENVIHRQLGQNEMADQMKGIDYLKSLPYVDANRIGVHGWSYGGFMTTSLMVNHPDVFKVGVCGGPVIDWKWYEVMYGERYMDTPQENPDGYDKVSLLGKAEKLQGKLLVIHGAQDDVVVMQHSMEFIKACIKAGRQVDYFIYPDHKHNVTGKDRVHLMEKVTEYFDLHLK